MTDPTLAQLQEVWPLSRYRCVHFGAIDAQPISCPSCALRAALAEGK
jgi:hypothetical protein